MPAELLPAPEPARPRFRPGARSRSAGRVPHAASPRSFRRMPHAFSAAGADPQNVFRPPSSPCPKVHRKRRKGLASPAPPPPASKGPFECRTGRLGGAMTRRPFLLGKYPACPAVGSGTNRSARICSALRLPMIPAALRCGRTKPLPRPRLPSAGWTETFGRGAALPPPLGCRSSDRPQARAGAYSAGHPSKFARTGGDSGIFVLSLHSVSTQTRG